MDPLRIAQLLYQYRKQVLFFAHFSVWLHCLFLGIAVWKGEFAWFDFNFWSWMFGFVIFTLIHIQFSED